MSRKEIISTKSVAVGPYSHGVECDGLVFLSGQTPIDSVTGKLVEDDISAQTQQSFKNLFDVLRSAGLSADSAQKVNVFLTNMDDFAAMNEVYKEQFSKPYPARTIIGVASLPLGAKEYN